MLRIRSAQVGAVVALAAGTLLGAAPAAAQTDYYNTDAGRPLRVEDARAVERYALELQLAPLLLQRASGGVYSWGIAPELAYGILPRTQIEIAFPLAWRDIPAGSGARRAGLAGVELAILHNLNVETLSLPAFAIAAELHAPLGALAGDETYTTIKGIATRTLSAARVHLNAAYTLGDEPASASPRAHADASRWMAGISLDRAFPLRSILVGAELVAEQPLHADDDMQWSAGTGIRWQWNPRVAVDVGVGHRFSGDDRSWSLTFGAAYAFGWRPLIPGLGR